MVSGPNLAKEIALRQPAASVVACAEEAVAEKLQLTCMTPYFRPYTNTDVVGVRARRRGQERHRARRRHRRRAWASATTRKASIITRGLAETARLGMALGADPRPSPASPGSATSSRPACRRCRATGRSARASAAACRSRR